jgi:hypothetical protein
MEDRIMTATEKLYLAMALVAFFAFGITLAVQAYRQGTK